MKWVFPLLALLTGCASLTPDNRSPEQIKASASDRSIEVKCALVTTPWGPQRTILLTVDRSAINSGAVSATSDCQVSVQADSKPGASK